jgi:hypothetical protein
MRVVVVLAAFVAACGVSCSVAQLPPPGRALCYAGADQRAQTRVDSECRIGDAVVAFSVCPAHDEIMAQLKADQKACK